MPADAEPPHRHVDTTTPRPDDRLQVLPVRLASQDDHPSCLAHIVAEGSAATPAAQSWRSWADMLLSVTSYGEMPLSGFRARSTDSGCSSTRPALMQKPSVTSHAIALRACVEPDRVLACELAWEVHRHGYWSQVRRPDGTAYDCRDRGKGGRFGQSSGDLPRGLSGVLARMGDPSRRLATGAYGSRPRSRGLGRGVLPTWAKWSRNRMLRRRIRHGLSAS